MDWVLKFFPPIILAGARVQYKMLLWNVSLSHFLHNYLPDACQIHFLSWGHREWGWGKMCNKPVGEMTWSILKCLENQRSKDYRWTVRWRSPDVSCNLRTNLAIWDCVKVWSRGANISKMARSNLWLRNFNAFITIINVDCLKCFKTQFAMHAADVRRDIE